MRVVVDQEMCCGSGHCVQIAPVVFDQDQDNGSVIVLAASPPLETHEAVREAAIVCPGSAIRVMES
ncbi:ferredoxin [Streptomyces sp. NPDC005492]|uniref:ferredoxin n=1 Tax=Streptomyces sp. NPDC005492 TaxID=3156883 RepID=UPI0033BB39E7